MLQSAGFTVANSISNEPEFNHNLALSKESSHADLSNNSRRSIVFMKNQQGLKVHIDDNQDASNEITYNRKNVSLGFSAGVH